MLENYFYDLESISDFGIVTAKTCHVRTFPRIAKDARFERLPCLHKGTYADDCLVNRVTQVRSYFLLYFVRVTSSFAVLS